MKEFLKDLLIAAVIVFVISIFFQPTIVREESMEPTLNPNNYIIMSKQAFTIGEMEHGDIIIFESTLKDENGKNKLLIKRAIALPGDTVEIRKGVVYLNGNVLDEPYVKYESDWDNIKPTKIPEGKVFALGDNRPLSMDSRYEEIGLVDMSTVKGEAVLRLYPFNKIGFLK